MLQMVKICVFTPLHAGDVVGNGVAGDTVGSGVGFGVIGAPVGDVVGPG